MNRGATLVIIINDHLNATVLPSKHGKLHEKPNSFFYLVPILSNHRLSSTRGKEVLFFLFRICELFDCII